MRNVGSSLRIIWKLSGSYCYEEVLEEVSCVIMKSQNESIWTLAKKILICSLNRCGRKYVETFRNMPINII